MASRPTRVPQPYQVLFPIGLSFALIGAGSWPVHALGWAPYPGALHRSLMIQGFELGFVLGFLLTAMPAFTHGPRCHPIELGWAVMTLLGFGAASLLGVGSAAQVFFLLALGLPLAAGLRRMAGNPRHPPEEFVFVGFGLVLGIAGAASSLAQSFGVSLPLPPRFADRLLSLGMVLSLVVGVGSLLVPTFAGLRAPLEIPGLARPHERNGRRVLYAAILAALASAFAIDAAGHAGLGMTVRAVVVTTMVVWVWKLYRLPRRDVPGFVLWSAGWFLPAGLWAAVAFPAHAIGALHLTFMGGFALLTFGVGTRVVVSHGGHALARERLLLDVPWSSGFLVAMVLRVAAEWLPTHALALWGLSGSLWLVTCVGWAWRVVRLPSAPGPEPHRI